MLNIPSKLCVGYNSRTDTYSGKLGYVVYYKGKKNSILAKETSFEGWRDKKLESLYSQDAKDEIELNNIIKDLCF